MNSEDQGDLLTELGGAFTNQDLVSRIVPEREIQHKQEKRWWIAGVIGISTALLAIVFD